MSPRTQAGALIAVAASVALAAWGILEWRRTARNEASLDSRIAQRHVASKGTAVPCDQLRQLRPLVLLALGQSNAANHGTHGGTPQLPVHSIAPTGYCHWLVDPLPGATGHGSSIWGRLPAALTEEGLHRPVALAVLAVDATSMADWTRPGSKLAVLLDDMLQHMHKLGLPPDLVLWQQGEADARAQTKPEEYLAGLRILVDRIHRQGSPVPVVLARSTVCRSQPSSALRQAIEQAVSGDTRLRLGPDTDTLSPATHREDGCHFNAPGIQAAATLWAQVIAGQVLATPAK
jgi:hypothetical protein